MAQTTRKFIRTYQGLIISFVMMGGVGAGVIFGLIPTVQKIIAIREESSVLIKQDDLLRAKATTLDNADEDTYKKYLAELAVAVPPDKSLTTVFSTIDGLGTLTGVALSGFTLTKPGGLATESAARLSNEEKQVGSNLLPFSLSVEGTYPQIHNFLATVNRVRRFFRVRYFDISFAKDETVTAKLGMDAFYAVLPTKLGSAEQSIEALSPEDQDVISKITELPILSSVASEQTADQTPLAPTTSDRADPFSP